MSTVCETIIKDKEMLRTMLLEQTRRSTNIASLIVDGKISPEFREFKEAFNMIREKPVVYTQVISGATEGVDFDKPTGFDVDEMITKERPYVCKVLSGFGGKTSKLICFTPKRDSLYNLIERDYLETETSIVRFKSEIAESMKDPMFHAEAGLISYQEGTRPETVETLHKMKARYDAEKAILAELEERKNEMKRVLDKLAPRLVESCEEPVKGK